jgi:hypothetical protein
MAMQRLACDMKRVFQSFSVLARTMLRSISTDEALTQMPSVLNGGHMLLILPKCVLPALPFVVFLTGATSNQLD